MLYSMIIITTTTITLVLLLLVSLFWVLHVLPSVCPHAVSAGLLILEQILKGIAPFNLTTFLAMTFRSTTTSAAGT